MKQIIESISCKYFGIVPKYITPLGGGFYGRVFLIELDKEPFNAVIKVFLYPDLAEKEARQLKILSVHSIFKIPEVYFIHNSSHEIPNDAIVMEYISGINAGNSDLILTDINRNMIAESIVNNLFYLPIKDARLIHGDYNTWNILLDESLTYVKAVIDPFNCCWADSELDLYQLNNANGKYYGLLDLYASKFTLSENFPLKNSFYELFSEIMHFHDANIDIKFSNIPKESIELERQMKYFALM